MSINGTAACHVLSGEGVVLMALVHLDGDACLPMMRASNGRPFVVLFALSLSSKLKFKCLTLVSCKAIVLHFTEQNVPTLEVRLPCDTSTLKFAEKYFNLRHYAKIEVIYQLEQCINSLNI